MLFTKRFVGNTWGVLDADWLLGVTKRLELALERPCEEPDLLAAAPPVGILEALLAEEEVEALGSLEDEEGGRRPRFWADEEPLESWETRTGRGPGAVPIERREPPGMVGMAGVHGDSLKERDNFTRNSLGEIKDWTEVEKT